MTSAQAVSNNPPAILVVDSSKVLLVTARKLLESHFRVCLADTVQAAWDLLGSTPTVTAVFTEQDMPGEASNAMLARIRAATDERIANLPIIVITSGERNEASRRAAIDAGATDFILKPFDAVDLVTRAGAWSNMSRRAALLHADNTLLRSLTMIDPDTRAGNRNYFLQELIKGRSFSVRHGGDHTLLYIAVDNYSRILHEQGSAAALEAVALVADGIRSKCRHEDTFARIADNEFALSLLQTSQIGARVLAERIRQTVGLKPFKPRGMLVTITVSIGVSMPPRDADLTAAQMLDMAARAAKQAARAGGNQTFVSTETAVKATSAATEAVVDREEATTSNLLTAADLDAVLANPQEFIRQLLPICRRINDAERLQLIDQLLKMVETSRHLQEVSPR